MLLCCWIIVELELDGGLCVVCCVFGGFGLFLFVVVDCWLLVVFCRLSTFFFMD